MLVAPQYFAQYFTTILLNSSSQYSYKCLLHVITSHIFLYNTSQYISTILQNISPQYFTILHNTLQFFSTKSLLITSPQCPLYNNTFLHLVISNNANYVHQYNPSDHRLNYAASLDSYTRLLRLLRGFFYCSINTLKSILHINDFIIYQELLTNYLSQISTLMLATGKETIHYLPSGRTHTLLS